MIFEVSTGVTQTQEDSHCVNTFYEMKISQMTRCGKYYNLTYWAFHTFKISPMLKQDDVNNRSSLTA